MHDLLDPRYIHRAKDAAPGLVVRSGAAPIKWYDLGEPANGMTTETRALACDALYDFGTILTIDHAGFAILHQCNPSFAFLLIAKWRGNYELWQSVQYIDAPSTPLPPLLPHTLHLQICA